MSLSTPGIRQTSIQTIWQCKLKNPWDSFLRTTESYRELNDIYHYFELAVVNFPCSNLYNKQQIHIWPREILGVFLYGIKNGSRGHIFLCYSWNSVIRRHPSYPGEIYVALNGSSPGILGRMVIMQKGSHILDVVTIEAVVNLKRHQLSASHYVLTLLLRIDFL